jgi:hypothetical protein
MDGPLEETFTSDFLQALAFTPCPTSLMGDISPHGVNSGVIQIGSHQLHVHAWASMSDESDESCHLYE